MKGVLKGKLMKKLKTIKTIGYNLKPERILHVNAFDSYFYTSPQKSTPDSRPPFSAIQEEPEKHPNENRLPAQKPEIIDDSDLMKDLEDREMEFDTDDTNDKENIRPETEAETPNDDPESFRRPDLNSCTLFDPNLLADFKQAVIEAKELEAERRSRIFEESDSRVEFDEPPSKSRKVEQIMNPITEFEEKCPPGGSEMIVLYTTGIRGIRKTFEDCTKIRSLLQNLRVSFYERDVSMHLEFKEEMWRILGGKFVPPRLFIKGRYIGGAEEVLGLLEQGKLKQLIEGIPIDTNEGPCDGCAGFRFVVCFDCNGSRKILPENGGGSVDCSECNENGVIVCPFCC